MKKCVIGGYTIVVVLVILLASYFTFCQSNSKVVGRQEGVVKVHDHYTLTMVQDENTSTGEKYIYRWKISDVPVNGATYTFYSVHQNVFYYIDDELVAYLKVNENNRFGSTTFADWATCNITKQDEGKTMTVEIESLYEGVENYPKEFLYGDYAEIKDSVISKNRIAMVIGMVLVTLGAGFIIFGLFTRKNTSEDRGVLALGAFSVCAGIWKLSDMRCTPLLYGNAQGFGLLSIIVLPLIVVPYLHFLSVLFQKKNKKIWNAVEIISIIQCFVVVFLQLFNIVDVRQTLVSTHLVIGTVILIVIILVSYESKFEKWSTKLTVSIICSLLCLIGTAADILVFYISKDSGNVFFCISAFLVYTICMGYLSIKETKELMELGKEAKRYEQIAMHDGLTGLFSRAFYNEYLHRHDFNRGDCSVIMFDMNHLKKSNDTYGHNFGDRRLQDFADILKRTFGEIGKVCRFGGDEFCVIIRKDESKNWLKALTVYEEEIKAYNEKENCPILLSAAYGYATFDEKEDEDFSSTIRRADKMMYQMQVLMKMERKEDE